jgi:hypothetical protein
MKTRGVLAAMIVVLSSCKTIAYYDSPNDLNYINGTLYLTNGEKIDGKLSINESTGGPVKLYVDGEKKPQRYRFPEIEGYSIRNEFYEFKEILDGMTFNRAYRFRFMKRLTPAHSKIHLYEYLDKQTYSRDGHRRSPGITSIDKEYYIQLPSEKEDGVWNISLSRFTPNFDEKMSKIVNDCPALSQKIANKKKGYFYSQVGGSEETRVDMLWNIISEYNECQ